MKSKIAVISIFCILISTMAHAMGSDIDRNGLWDDVQQNLTVFNDTDNSKEAYSAAVQFAKATQKIAMLNNKRDDKSRYVQAAQKYINALECMYYLTFGKPDYYIRSIQLVTLKTPARQQAYSNNIVLIDQLNLSPRENAQDWWKGCDFQMKPVDNWGVIKEEAN